MREIGRCIAGEAWLGLQGLTVLVPGGPSSIDDGPMITLDGMPLHVLTDDDHRV